jgi:hypothetical protein
MDQEYDRYLLIIFFLEIFRYLLNGIDDAPERLRVIDI